MSAINTDQLTSDQLAGKIFIGTVVNNKHPDQLARVRVYIPDLHDEGDKANAPWAAIIRPVHRGANGAPGFFAVPRVDSRVCVMFDKGDLHSPIIIGEMVDGKAKVGELAADYPQSWGYEDEHHNVFITDLGTDITTYRHSSGTSCIIDKQGNMSVKVVANLKVEVAQNTDIQTTGNTTIGSGGNIAINAGGSMSITAGGTTKVDSSGAISISAPITQFSGAVKDNGASIDSGHVHQGVHGTTSPPIN